MTRAELKTLRDSLILTGGRRTTAVSVNTVLGAIIDYVLNTEDDENTVYAAKVGGIQFDSQVGYADEDQVIDNLGSFVNYKLFTTQLQAVTDLISLTPIADFFTTVGNEIGTGETNLYLKSIVANTLTVNGDKLNVFYSGAFVATASDTRQVRVKFGGTTILDTSTLSISGSGVKWNIRGNIIRVSKSVLRYAFDFICDDLAAPIINRSGELTGIDVEVNAYDLLLTGESAGAGSGDNDITATSGNIVFIKAAS